MIKKIKIILSIALLSLSTLNYAYSCPQTINMQFTDKQNNVINMLGVVSHSDSRHTYILTHRENQSDLTLLTMYSGSKRDPQYLLENNFNAPHVIKQKNKFTLYKIENSNFTQYGEEYIHAYNLHAYDLSRYNAPSDLTISTPHYCQQLPTAGYSASNDALHLPIQQTLTQREIKTIRDYSLPVFNYDEGKAKLIGFVKKNTISMTSSEDGATYTAGIQIDLIPQVFENFMDRIKLENKSIANYRGIGIPIYACDNSYRNKKSCRSYLQAGKPKYWYTEENSVHQLTEGDIISAVYFKNYHNRWQERNYGADVNTFKREFNHYLHMHRKDNNKGCTDATLNFHVQNSFEITQDKRVAVAGCWRPYVIH
jgi:hypothetical protein